MRRSRGRKEQECGNRNSSLVRSRPGRMLSGSQGFESSPSAEWLHWALDPGGNSTGGLGERVSVTVMRSQAADCRELGTNGSWKQIDS